MVGRNGTMKCICIGSIQCYVKYPTLIEKSRNYHGVKGGGSLLQYPELTTIVVCNKSPLSRTGER